jgi:hypothetical protein
MSVGWLHTLLVAWKCKRLMTSTTVDAAPEQTRTYHHDYDDPEADWYIMTTISIVHFDYNHVRMCTTHRIAQKSAS